MGLSAKSLNLLTFHNANHAHKFCSFILTILVIKDMQINNSRLAEVGSLFSTSECRWNIVIWY